MKTKTTAEKTIFYLILLLLPSNLGLHFPQSWSFIHGILIDYLIPTIYLTDILIIILLFLWFKKLLKSKNRKLINIKSSFSIALFLLLSASFFKAYNLPASLYKLLKIVELGLFSTWIKNRINLKKEFNNIINILSFSVIWQSLLSYAQWIKQSSIFGFWFLGEQSYNSTTLNIKKVNIFGQLKIPPYGTFPHPNVLAGFLCLYLILTIPPSKHLTATAFLLGLLSLFLTFSFSSWTVLLSFFILFTLVKIKSKKLKLFITMSILTLITIISAYWIKYGNRSSLTRRQNLVEIAVKMWRSSPFLGIGPNNFIVRMEDFGQVITNHRFLQPVHNIFLIILAETGILGIIIIASLILKISTKLWQTKKNKISLKLLFSLTSIITLGLFDHYFLTIQQGMLLLFLIIGLIFSRI